MVNILESRTTLWSKARGLETPPLAICDRQCSNLRQAEGAVFNPSGIFYVLQICISKYNVFDPCKQGF